jgi:sugar/nucleoside kinase (ribokinase family)
VKQGLAVEVTGCLGKDPSAQVLLSNLENNGVNCQRIVFSKTLPTSKTVILLVKGQDRRYIHSFGANADFRVQDIDREWLRELDIFYLGGLFLMPAFDPIGFIDLLKFCRSHKIISVVDVVIPQNFELPSDLKPLLSNIDYFMPNDDEAKRLTGHNDPKMMLQTLLEWGAGTVFLTLGKNGVMAGTQETHWQASIYPVKMLDPSGSGDAFAAGILTGIANGWEISGMIRYASALGASAVRTLGTTDGVFTREEAELFIKKFPLEITIE